MDRSLYKSQCSLLKLYSNKYSFIPIGLLKHNFGAVCKNMSCSPSCGNCVCLICSYGPSALNSVFVITLCADEYFSVTRVRTYRFFTNISEGWVHRTVC